MELIVDSSIKISVHWADEVRKVNTQVEDNNHDIKRLSESERGTFTCITGFSSGEQMGKSKAEERDW